MMLSNRSMPLLRENAESFEQLAAYQGLRGDGTGVTLRGARVSPSLFPLFECRRIWAGSSWRKKRGPARRASRC